MKKINIPVCVISLNSVIKSVIKLQRCFYERENFLKMMETLSYIKSGSSLIFKLFINYK